MKSESALPYFFYIFFDGRVASTPHRVAISEVPGATYGRVNVESFSFCLGSGCWGIVVVADLHYALVTFI